jgi:hypothetical protein
MMSDHLSDANYKVPVKGVGENLLPTAQARGLGRAGPPVAAQGTGSSQMNLFCHLGPGQTLLAKLHDLLGGRGKSRSAATHRDASTAKLIAHGNPGNAQLGTNLARAPTLRVQVGPRLTSTATPCNHVSSARESGLGTQ